ncbi:hypothetical protein GQ457_05G020890 [Hibiscus cannabinus]
MCLEQVPIPEPEYQYPLLQKCIKYEKSTLQWLESISQQRRCWKFISDYKLWEIIVDGPTIPRKIVGYVLVPMERLEWSDQERKLVQLNAKAMHVLIYALCPKEYVKVSSCTVDRD